MLALLSLSRLLKKAHLPRPILRTGAPRTRAALRRTDQVRLAPRIARRPAKPRDIWTLLSSLGENGFFSREMTGGK
jgi:hypothetical protein